MDINCIKSNPNNPRVIRDAKYKQLLKSIKDFPQMLNLRPLVIDENNMVLGGNMRLKALKELGYKEVPVMKADELNDEQKKEFIIKDNLPYGEWDTEMLANEWDTEQLQEWGLDVPSWDPQEETEPSDYDQQQNWFLNIRFATEQECQQWYERLLKEGLDIKIVS